MSRAWQSSSYSTKAHRAPSAGGQAQPSEHPAEVFAFLDMDRSAVDFSDVANDCEAEARAWLTGGVQPRAALEQLAATLGRDTRSVVLDQDVDLLRPWLDRHEHAAAAIFGGILDEVAEHFVKILAFNPDLRAVIAGDVDGDALVKAVHSALHRLEAFPDRRP